MVSNFHSIYVPVSFGLLILHLDLLSSVESVDISQVEKLSSEPLYFPRSPDGLSMKMGGHTLSSSMFNRIKFANSEAATRACLQLLDVVACPLPLDSISFRLPYIRDGFSWALQSLQGIWRAVFEWFKSPGSSQEETKLINLITDIVALFRKWFSYSLRLGLGFDEKASHAWLRCGCDMLASEKFRTSLDMQHVVSQLLNEAVSASHSSPAIGHSIEENFLQSLTDLQRDGQAYESLHQSLQVVSSPS